MNVCETIKQLNSEKTDAFMHELYGKEQLKIRQDMRKY